MKMTDMRVYIDKSNVKIYEDLQKITGADFHVLFFLCVCLAVSRNAEPKPLNKRIEKFWARTMTPTEWSCIYSIILAQNAMNLKSVEDDENVMLQMEAIANSGIDIITDDLLNEYIKIVDGTKSLYLSGNNGDAIKALLCSLMSDYIDKVEE